MTGQSIEHEHSDNRGESRKQNRQLVRDRKRKHRTEVRLTTNDQRIIHRASPEDEGHTRAKPDDASNERNPRNNGTFKTHCSIETVNRARSDTIPVFVTGIAHLLRRMVEIHSVIKRGD